MTHLESITKFERKEIIRLVKRPQGLTINAWEIIEGEIENEDTETFFDAEKAAEMVFNRSQDVFGSISFNY